MVDTQKIGNRIKSLRTRKKLSQPELAKLAGCHVNTITGLESGSSNDVRLGTLNNLSDALGVTTKHLIHGA